MGPSSRSSANSKDIHQQNQSTSTKSANSCSDGINFRVLVGVPRELAELQLQPKKTSLSCIRPGQAVRERCFDLLSCSQGVRAGIFFPGQDGI
jgi:hypothetical protein